MQAGTYKLVQVAGGSWSLHSTEFRETFHPVVGPVAEAEALYLKQVKLLDRLRTHAEEFVVWDIGLGAAANVLTILRAASEVPSQLRVISFDNTLEPLAFALENREKLGYFGGFEAAAQEVLSSRSAQFRHRAAAVRWELHLADFPTFAKSPQAGSLPKPDLILFDAFSPARNPAMWTLPLFSSVFALLDPQRPCVMPTYSRSTMLRVTLLLAGFYVGVGHATGEKEETTIASNRLEELAEPLTADWLARAKRSTSAEPMREPAYRQQPLSEESLSQLLAHPQFQSEMA